MSLRPELLEALGRIGFVKATDVQEQVIPIAMQNKDVIVRAKTGTGKTGAFIIPIIQRISRGRAPEAIIMAPTRELAIQIADFTRKLTRRREDVAIVYGGASINVQIDSLKGNPSIVIGTPGRIIDLMERGALELSQIRFLVLDEADTMLDMGFIDDIEFIMSKTPRGKQTLLFSATMPDRVMSVAKRHMHDFSFLSIGSEESLIVSGIKHYYAVSEGRYKFATLLAYIKQYTPKKAIIFVQTKYAASAICDALKANGIGAMLMHGGLTQAKREHSLKMFRNEARFLIATGVAARGIDVRSITDIINFDIPDDPYVYVHKVGRAARMESSGRSFTIVSQDQLNLVKDIEITANINMERLNLDIREFMHTRAFSKRREGHDRQFGRDREHGRFGRERETSNRGYRGRSQRRGFRYSDNRNNY